MAITWNNTTKTIAVSGGTSEAPVTFISVEDFNALSIPAADATFVSGSPGSLILKSNTILEISGHVVKPASLTAALHYYFEDASQLVMKPSSVFSVGENESDSLTMWAQNRTTPFNTVAKTSSTGATFRLTPTSPATVVTGGIPVSSNIVAYSVFYNGGVGGATAFGAADNFAATGGNPPPSAIDTTKTAYLPGNTATYANLINTSFGINGLLLDFDTTLGTVTTSDFEFATGETTLASGWTTLAGGALSAIGFAVTKYAGASPSIKNRLKLTFTNGVVKNTWLRITVKGNSNTGLNRDHVFCFGSMVGKMNPNGQSSGYFRTNATDTSQVSQNQSTVPGSVALTTRYDCNKTSNTNSIDTSLVRDNQFATGLLKVLGPTSMSDC